MSELAGRPISPGHHRSGRQQDGCGETRWTFVSQAIGMVGAAIPLVHLGATTALGIWGLYLVFPAEANVPAALNYYRSTRKNGKRSAGSTARISRTRRIRRSSHEHQISRHE